MKHITIGTRASKLAMIQTNLVIERLRQQWPNLEITIEQIRTTGDRVADRPLSQIGGDGVFVIEIERALQERRIDLAVHSLKDLPTAQPQGLRLVITGPREDVRDVFVSNNPALRSLESGLSISRRGGGGMEQGGDPWVALDPSNLLISRRGGGGMEQGGDPWVALDAPRIGTSSLRRTAQIRALWPDAKILPIRGNVDTRLRKLEAGKYDGIVLAAAGLHRLGLQERLEGRVVYFPIDSMLPAPGQGALALEIRDEPEIYELLSSLNDPVTQATTVAERMFMRQLGAGCYLPIAAYGEISAESLTLLGLVISLDGQRQVRVRQSIHWTLAASIEHAEQLGKTLAEQAFAEGAGDIISTIDARKCSGEACPRQAPNIPRQVPNVHSSNRFDAKSLPLQGKRVLVTRTREQAAALSERLQALGAIAVEFPVIRIVPPHDWEALDSALGKLGRDLSRPYYKWVVFTSANGVNIFCERLLSLGFHLQALTNVRVAAIGPATASALARYGITANLVPTEYVAESVASALIEDARRGGESLEGRRILLPRAAEARKILVTVLQQAGAIVDEVAAYHTGSAASDDEQGRAVLHLLQTGQIDIITFTSSSTVRNFMQWLGDCVAEFDESGIGSGDHEPGDTGNVVATLAVARSIVARLAVVRSLLPKVACIGPITAQTARDFGLDVAIEARAFTIGGLVEAIVQFEG